MNNIIPSINYLRARCFSAVNHQQYRTNFLNKLNQMIGTPSEYFKQNKDLRNLSIAEFNRYQNLDYIQTTNLKLGKVSHDSGFVKRISGNQQELLIPSENASAIDLSKYKNEIAEQVLNGKIITMHFFGGMGERLNLPKGTSKYELNAKQLADPFKKEYPDLFYNQDLDIISDSVSDLTLGERHMFALSKAIHDLAIEYNMHPDDALKNQYIFIISNPDNDSLIRESFKNCNYFGFDPEKIFIMVSQDYPAIVLDPTGQKLIEHTSETITHNHGAAIMQAVMDDVWTRIDNPGKKVATDKIKEIFKSSRNLQTLNIEDVSYLNNPLDIYAYMIANGMVLDEYKNFSMMMDVVGQNPAKPHKGGVLAIDPYFYGIYGKRMTMLEAFTTYPLYYHWDDKIAQEKGLYKNIEWLNLNNNNFPNPINMFNLLRTNGLPAYIEAKEKNGIINLRNECPQGELCHFQPTLFVARTFDWGNNKIKPVELLSVKSIEHIPLGLFAFFRQDNDSGFLNFIRNYKL